MHQSLPPQQNFHFEEMSQQNNGGMPSAGAQQQYHADGMSGAEMHNHEQHYLNGGMPSAELHDHHEQNDTDHYTFDETTEPLFDDLYYAQGDY